MFTKLNTKFIVDEKGNKKGVIINIKDYENLIEFITDLEDANELLKAEREAKKFVPYDKFRKKLKRENRL